jgi:hypothetical protein
MGSGFSFSSEGIPHLTMPMAPLHRRHNAEQLILALFSARNVVFKLTFFVIFSKRSSADLGLIAKFHFSILVREIS